MKIAILGASRGLGRCLVEHIRMQHPQTEFFLSSRNFEQLGAIAQSSDHVATYDFTNHKTQNLMIDELLNFRPQMIFYVAGGGPYGQFNKREWKDHLWALELNLIFPARLAHAFLNLPPKELSLETFVVVGSAIAGRKADPMASAYAAAKHGIRGLIESLALEKHPINFKIYEPGYMDTTMLPANAWPRQQGLVKSAEEEARNLWQFSLT